MHDRESKMKLRICTSRIGARITCLLGLLFLMLIAGAFAVALGVRNQSIQHATEKMDAFSKSIVAEQASTLELVRQIASIVSQDRDMDELGQKPYCSGSLNALRKTDRHILNVMIADARGQLVCDALGGKKPVNMAQRDFFRRLLVNPDPVVGEPILGNVTGRWLLPVAQRIVDKEGNFRGVFVVSLDLDWTIQESMRQHPLPGLRIGLFKPDGTVVVSYPQLNAWRGKNIKDYPAFQQMLAQGGVGSAQLDAHDGEDRLYLFSRFAETISGPVFWWATVPMDMVTSEANRFFMWFLLVATSTLVLSFFFVWYRSDKELVRPLAAIGAVATNLGRGNHVVRTGIAHTDDDIGRLASAFDQMAIALSSKNEIVRLNRALRVISECNRILIQSKCDKELFEELCRIMVNMGGYRMAWVGVPVQDSAKSIQVLAIAGLNNDYLDQSRITWSDDEHRHGAAGVAMRTGQSQFNQDFTRLPEGSALRLVAEKHGFRASSSLALVLDGQVYGALTIYSGAVEPFSDEEIHLLEQLAQDVSFGISAIALRTARDSSLQRLERSLESTVRAIAYTLELRDPYTAGHERRVAQLAVAIARKLGLPEYDIQGIQLAAEVHDLGKIRIPAEILSKPTRLTELEYRMIQEHPGSGYDILKGIDFPWPIADMVGQHHERMNGTGYPKGLKGEEILIGARIIAVADVVEAMASHRPYRAGLGISVALDELERNRGVFYDAAVVDACVTLIRQEHYKIG